MRFSPRPCPFCGWGTIVDTGIIKHACKCKSCGARTRGYKTWEEAVAAWNNRYYATGGLITHEEMASLWEKVKNV